MAGYGDNTEFQAWLTAQGITLPTTAPTDDVLRQIGSDYVDSAYEHALQCSRRAGGFAQALAWPRTGHRVNGQSVPDDLIPQAWINASYRAAYLEATTPGWATGSVSPDRITKREKVDTIEREFFAAGEVGASDAALGMPSDALINGMIKMWLCGQGRDPNSLFRVI